MINYPVDVENTRWALYDTDASAVLHRNRRWPRADGGEVINLAVNLVPLLEVVEDQPTYDPDTHRLTRNDPVVDIAANTITTEWTLVPLDQAELDEIAEREQIKAVYQAVKNGVGTNLERLVRVEKVLAHLLKLEYGEQ